MKTCKKRNCDQEVTGRKHYCNSFCQYWEGQMRKDDNRGLPPVKKRTKDWFHLYTGSSYPRGQGKRSGGMIVGAMTGVPIANFDLVRTTKENLDKHFKHQHVRQAELGDGSKINREDYESNNPRKYFNQAIPV